MNIKKAISLIILTVIFGVATIYFNPFNMFGAQEAPIDINLYMLSVDEGLFCEDITRIQDSVYVACVSSEGEILLFKLGEGIIYTSKEYLESFGTFRTARFIGNYLLYFNQTDRQLKIHFYNILSGESWAVDLEAEILKYGVIPFGDGYLVTSESGSWHIYREGGVPKIEEYPYEFGRNILLTDSGFLYFDSMVTNGLMKVVIDGDKYLLNVTFINDIKYIGNEYVFILGYDPGDEVWRIFLLNLGIKEIVGYEELRHSGVSLAGYTPNSVYLFASNVNDTYEAALIEYDVKSGELLEISKYRDFYVSWAYGADDVLLVLGGYKAESEESSHRYSLIVYVGGDLWREFDVLSPVVLKEKIFDDRLYLLIPEMLGSETDLSGLSFQVVEIIFKKM